MSIEQNNKILASDVTTSVKAAMDKANSAISGLSVSGRTITYTKGDGTTGTITTQDTDTKYTLPNATSSTLGGVKVGSNISVSSGTISLSKSNVTTALGYTPVKSVNGTVVDSVGNVNVSASPSTVKGVIGSAVASDGTSITLPSGGTWFVWNIYGGADRTYGSYKDGSGANAENVRYAETDYYGVSTVSGSSASGFVNAGSTFSGGTTVYAKKKDNTQPSTYSYSDVGKLAAIRIS